MRVVTALIFVLLSASAFPQKDAGTYKDYFLEGTYLLLENNPEKALANFEAAYRLDSSSANINAMLGTCYLQSKEQKARAEQFLEKGIRKIAKNYVMDDPAETSAPSISLLYYGQALHINYKFDEAIKAYESFRKYLDPKDEEYRKILDKEIATSKLAKLMVANPINVQITNMGDSINSQYPDYAAVLSADERTMIFTTGRPNTTGGMKNDDGHYYEDIVVSYKQDNDQWTKPVSLSANVNTFGPDASINLTPDGQTLIVFKNDSDPKLPEGNGNIYYTTYDGKDWSPLKDFGSDVNSEDWESHACLNADGSILFFTSERPGGLGGKDIYRCVKLPNGKWSKALNMGAPINTEYDEDGAFIHPDGKTFFFASNSPLSMGGYDIMFAILDEENKFSNVTNIGYPINTPDDDVFYVTSPDGKRGYFSSAKAGGFGEKDIYKITLAEPRETFLALFKGQLIPAEGETLPGNITIIVTDKQSNEIIGTYRPKLVNGTFSTILPPGREYNFSYQTDDGEEFYNEDVFVSNDQAYQEIKREVSLEPVKLGGKLKVKQKSIVLNVIVLNNSRSKKPVPNAKIIIEEEGAAKQFFDAGANGEYDGIDLQPEKKYSVYTESNERKSLPAEINTIGNKSAKIINQVIYLEGKAEKFTSKEVLLDIAVKERKTRRGVPNTAIILTDEDGEKYEDTTDAKGLLKGIEMAPEMKYELYANKDGNVSEMVTFTTGTVAEAKRLSKTLYVLYEPVTASSGKKGRRKGEPIEPGSLYKFTYKYGRKVINEHEKSWLAFIAYIVEKSKTKPLVTVYIQSSASKVPTRTRGGNKTLAAVRGKKFEALLKKTLKEQQTDLSKIRFVRRWVVAGPDYRGDWRIGRKKYEKFQYVRGRVK
jgi:tetratricopeptide (TPR) repeat protein